MPVKVQYFLDLKNKLKLVMTLARFFSPKNSAKSSGNSSTYFGLLARLLNPDLLGCTLFVTRKDTGNKISKMQFI